MRRGKQAIHFDFKMLLIKFDPCGLTHLSENLTMQSLLSLLMLPLLVVIGVYASMII